MSPTSPPPQLLRGTVDWTRVTPGPSWANQSLSPWLGIRAKRVSLHLELISLGAEVWRLISAPLDREAEKARPQSMWMKQPTWREAAWDPSALPDSAASLSEP